VKPLRLKKVLLLAAVSVSTIGLALAADRSAEESAEGRKGGDFQREAPKMLPDWSEGRTSILGPFVWSRALDLGEDARFSDANGMASHQGEYLWCYQYARLPRKKGLTEILHARNNFVSRREDVCYTVQPSHFILNTTGAHNSKIVVGYVQNQTPPFQNADNADLAHLAAGDRVCLFIPVRPKPGSKDPLDQKRYNVNNITGIQPICVVQFKKGEMIHYEWFQDEKNLDGHVLLNLAEHFRGENVLRPGVTKPLFRFDVDGKGGWTVRIERDGRDGLAGGEVDDGWDLTFTHESPDAKPYTVDVTNDNSAWAMSIFSPGGKPMETSEILIGLKPYDRQSGKPVTWPARNIRIRQLKVKDLEKTADKLNRGDGK
jgi:hypothetical protein